MVVFVCSHLEYIKDGKECMVMKFHVSGKKRKGIARLDLMKVGNSTDLSRVSLTYLSDIQAAFVMFVHTRVLVLSLMLMFPLLRMTRASTSASIWMWS